jgi:hypothetical protein
MEQRKYSTGTKGRLKKHSDECREFIQANAPSFSLANEFIESIDAERDDKVWQKYMTPESLRPELDAWLNGEPAPTHTASLHPKILKASELKPQDA